MGSKPSVREDLASSGTRAESPGTPPESVRREACRQLDSRSPAQPLLRPAACKRRTRVTRRSPTRQPPWKKVADFGSLADSLLGSPMALRPDLAIGLPFRVPAGLPRASPGATGIPIRYLGHETGCVKRGRRPGYSQVVRRKAFSYQLSAISFQLSAFGTVSGEKRRARRLLTADG